MYAIRYANSSDKNFWFNNDKNMDESMFENKIWNSLSYIITEGSMRIGLLRSSLFRDKIPFCNLLYIDEEYRNMGYDKILLLYWEQDMRARGHDLVMVSSFLGDMKYMFYRETGYQESGGIILPDDNNCKSMEIIMTKKL